jgi:hypothetical protein
LSVMKRKLRRKPLMIFSREFLKKSKFPDQSISRLSMAKMILIPFRGVKSPC